MTAERCVNCGGAATRFCDFVIGGVLAGYAEHNGAPYRISDIDKPPYTCDVPLCDSCATNAGSVFISGKNPGVDSIDYCPLHKHGNDAAWTPATEDEVRATRRNIAAHYRRKQFHDIKGAGN